MVKFKERSSAGEKIGGGFIIFRRHRKSGRVALPQIALPFEHASFEAAEKEMKRLAAKHEGNEFCIFYQVTSLKK